jgi:putative ABC transport system permease protein
MLQLNYFDDLRRDVAYATRVLGRTPGVALTALFTIALGIGASTAIFSIAYTVLFRPLSYRDPDRLVVVSERHLTEPALEGMSPATARDLLDRSRSIEAISLYADGAGGRLLENGEAEILRGQRVSPNFFETLGVRPLLGRVLESDDGLPGQSTAIVLSHELWQRRFGGDPGVIGRPLNLAGRPARVVGVLQADFHALHMSNPGEVPQLFQPFSIDVLQSQDRRTNITDVVRLKPGIPIGAARAELVRIFRDLKHEHPSDYPRDADLTVQSLDGKLAGKVRTILWVLLGAGGFVLLITCANVASLLLVRSNARTTEMAVRASLGGGRWRLVRQVCTESLVLSLFGGLFGLLLAWAGTLVLSKTAPAEISRFDEIRIDGSVSIFSFVASVFTGLLFSAAPALRAVRLNLNEVLAGSRDSSGGRDSRLPRNILVSAQIAFAFVLAVGAGLLARSLNQLIHTDAGYDPHHILTMTAFIYDRTEEQRLHHYQEIIARVQSLPSVESAAMASTVPLASPVQNSVQVEGRLMTNEAEAPIVDLYFATGSYFPLMRIPLRRGRLFNDFDNPHSVYVALISESLARQQFGTEDPIRKRIRLDARDGDGYAGWMTIIGVVGDVWQHGMDDGPSPGIYVPQSQHPEFYYRLLVRTTGDPWRIYPAVHDVMREIDPNQPFFHVQPMDDYVTKSLADRISALTLIGLLGTLALVLAAVGIYSIISYTVSLRTREIGIRMALGADSISVLGLVMKEVSIMLICGIASGFLISVVLARFLAHLLYHVSATDGEATITAATVLAGVAFGAAVVPSIRALNISPSKAL